MLNANRRPLALRFQIANRTYSINVGIFILRSIRIVHVSIFWGILSQSVYIVRIEFRPAFRLRDIVQLVYEGFGSGLLDNSRIDAEGRRWLCP